VPGGPFLYALTESGEVLVMPASNPGAASLAFTPNLAGTPAPLQAIDFHSPSNTLYGCAHDGLAWRWYRINPSNGTMTAITSGSYGATGQWGLSYDPSTQAFAVQYGAGGDNQTIGTTSGTLNPATALSGVAAGVAELAHTKQLPSVGTSSAYGLDLVGKQLIQLGPGNSTAPASGGTGTVVGSFNLANTLDPTAGFDIDGQTGTAYAAMSDPQPKLYTVNLVSGKASPVGAIAGTSATNRVVGLCVVE
jgi:hypothetical protein